MSLNRHFSRFALLAAALVLSAASLASGQDQKFGAHPPLQLGNPAAKVKIEVFSDYQCPAASSFFRKLKDVAAKHPEEVLITFRNAPLKQHINALPAAKAVEAAAAQGKFVEMMEMIYNSQDAWKADAAAADIFASYAKTLGLDTNRYALDVQGPIVLDRITQDVERAKSLKVAGTPWIFINEKLVSYGDAQDLEAIISHNDQEVN